MYYGINSGPLGMVSEFLFFKNQIENENSILQLLYFKFKYTSHIIFCSLYFKIENNNIHLVDN